MQITFANVSWRACGRSLAVVLGLFLSSIGLTASIAGPGHDHGAVNLSPAAAPSPRFVAGSTDYQLVGIVEGDVLVLYLDRFADNEPVITAKLEITIGDTPLNAQVQKNGTYEVASGLLKTPGEHSIIANITDGESTDLLVGALTIPKIQGAPYPPDHTLWSHLVPAGQPIQVAGIGMGALFLAAGLAGLVMRSSRRRAACVFSVIGIVVLAATSAFAHEGHDHGGETALANGNAPQRLPDGTIFLPKPTQRLLEIRTRILKPETIVRSTRFQGRIVANPNRSGIVQSTIQGRYSPPAGGVPPVGSRVRAGDLLGKIAPSFVSKEASDMMQALAELDQQITLTRSKLARNEQLLRSSVVSQVTVEEIRIQLDGLLKRRADLLEARVQPEELRAPVDGVITNARAVAGQVVSPTDQLFQIVDPSSFFVEALMFDHLSGDRIDAATATLAGGRVVPLRFLGRSRSLQQQYSILKFEVLEVTDELNVGAPVIVNGSTGAQTTGLRAPRSAVAQAPNGQMVVFLHKDAELFEPRPVRFEAFDADSVMLISGIASGDKIVVRNAPLVNQVR